MDEAGNIAFIRNHDVKDGGITVGVGIYVNEQNKERINMLENYGINWSSVDEWVSYDKVEMVFEEIESEYMDGVVDLLNKNKTLVSQEIIDALFLLSYNRKVFFTQGGTIDQLLGTGSQDIAEWETNILAEYQQINTWEMFKNSWTNRTRDILELYFWGDYDRTN